MQYNNCEPAVTCSIAAELLTVIQRKVDEAAEEMRKLHEEEFLIFITQNFVL
jgi:hypothetical protein